MIVVDTREPWEEVFEKLGDVGVDGGNYTLETLNEPEHPKADYLVGDGTTAIQRKEVNDFVGSLDGLKEDLHELRTAHDRSILLVEGNWKTAGSRIALRRGKSLEQTVPVSTWHNFIYSQQMRGTMYVRTNGLTETARALKSLDSYSEKEPSPPVDGIENPFVILQMVPGIGSVTAKNLVRHFGSTYETLVSVGRWDEVNGVGEKTKENAIEWFDSEEGPDD